VRGNFFDRLAARALGVARVSEPVLISRFSPVAQVAAMDSATAPNEGGETPARGRLSEDVGETTPSRTLPRRENSPKAGREPDAAQPELITRDLTLPEIGESRPRETTVIPPQYDTRVPPPAELEPTPSGVLLTSRTAKVFPPPPETTLPAQLEMQPVITRAVRGATDSSPHDSVNAGVAQRTGKNSSQLVPERASPVVRITIGRVEVRAQFPAAPSAPAARPSRALTLSLEDYLKQRSRGQR
jgi:hypothetical protein